MFRSIPALAGRALVRTTLVSLFVLCQLLRGGGPDHPAEGGGGGGLHDLRTHSCHAVQKQTCRTSHSDTYVSVTWPPLHVLLGVVASDDGNVKHPLANRLFFAPIPVPALFPRGRHPQA